MSLKGKIWNAVVLLIIACLWTGCGYSTSSLLRDDVHSIYVPVFDNKTWYRGLEVQLTRAIVDEVTLHTRLRIAPRDEADTILEGELVSFEQIAAVVSSGQDVQLTRITAAVEFRWVDNLTRREIVQKQTVRETALYPLTLAGPPGTPYGPPETLAFRQIAKRIVEKMERNW